MVLTGHYVVAQHQFAGFVNDKSNSTALVGANVVLQGHQTLVAATDAAGHFVFDDLPAGEYLITVSYVGYQEFQQTIRVPELDFLKITLTETPYLQDEVIVMATRAGKDAPLAYSEIKREELEEINMGKDMPYLLEGMP